MRFEFGEPGCVQVVSTRQAPYACFRNSRIHFQQYAMPESHAGEWFLYVLITKACGYRESSPVSRLICAPTQSARWPYTQGRDTCRSAKLGCSNIGNTFGAKMCIRSRSVAGNTSKLDVSILDGKKVSTHLVPRRQPCVSQRAIPFRLERLQEGTHCTYPR